MKSKVLKKQPINKRLFIFVAKISFMNILIIGGGGREHTFAWKIAQSPLCNQLFVAPGNAGTAAIATNLALGVNDFDGIKAAVIEHKITLVVVGPEDPLVNGIHDFFLADIDLKNIPVIGPQKAAAELEGSKDFAKEFLFRHNIPTAAYKTFTSENLEEGYTFLETLNAPYVLKANGLAAGKGLCRYFLQKHISLWCHSTTFSDYGTLCRWCGLLTSNY